MSGKVIEMIILICSYTQTKPKKKKKIGGFCFLSCLYFGSLLFTSLVHLGSFVFYINLLFIDQKKKRNTQTKPKK